MYFDRFDIMEAYYCFFVNYHEGQRSEKYKRLCKIKKYFKPSERMSKTAWPEDLLSENALEIYKNLAEKEESKK